MRPPFAFRNVVNDRSRAPGRINAVSDLRRPITPQTWFTNRARNALRRPAFIGAISAGTFVTAIVSMVVVPRAEQRPDAIIELPRPDTLTPAVTAAMQSVNLARAESLLVAARAELVATSAAAAAAIATESVPGSARDSALTALRELEALLERAEQAPLAASYKSLADAPALRRDPRIQPLLDSLAEIERERERFGAVGGVDPIFVALTTRANEIGREIRAVGAEHRAVMLAAIAPADSVNASVAAVPATDTAMLVASRDSIRLALDSATGVLTSLRAASLAVDLEEDRARERASAVAPPLALLASAFVLSGVLGFAFAFVGELRRPRVSDANELERQLGIRVLSTIEVMAPSSDRGRRQADRSAPPYFDPGGEGYQLAYLGLANEHPSVLTAIVTGDDARVSAVVACNLAAIAADEARNTLLIDSERSCSASAALRVRAAPGVSDILRHEASWPDVTIEARVGRDKSIHVVPCGTGPISDDALAALLRDDSARLERYYDALLLLAHPRSLAAGHGTALGSAEIVYCAQNGVTAIRDLRQAIEEIRMAGGSVRGVVLWNAPAPLLPTPRELTRKQTGGRGTQPALAAAGALGAS